MYQMAVSESFAFRVPAFWISDGNGNYLRKNGEISRTASDVLRGIELDFQDKNSAWHRTREQAQEALDKYNETHSIPNRDLRSSH
jgi:hypothetical protein